MLPVSIYPTSGCCVAVSIRVITRMRFFIGDRPTSS